MKPIICATAIALLIAGCATGPLKPGKSDISPKGIKFQQSQNPKDRSSQVYKKTTITEPAFRLPEDPAVTSKNLKVTITEEVTTTLGASQKDTGREIAAKLSSLKGVVWVGVVVFLFGAASAFYPPLKLIVGSTTTSAVACVAGVALIVLPSLIVGHELLILGAGIGTVVLYFFAHRHGSIHAELKTHKK